MSTAGQSTVTGDVEATEPPPVNLQHMQGLPGAFHELFGCHRSGCKALMHACLIPEQAVAGKGAQRHSILAFDVLPPTEPCCLLSSFKPLEMFSFPTGQRVCALCWRKQRMIALFLRAGPCACGWGITEELITACTSNCSALAKDEGQ